MTGSAAAIATLPARSFVIDLAVRSSAETTATRWVWEETRLSPEPEELWEICSLQGCRNRKGARSSRASGPLRRAARGGNPVHAFSLVLRRHHRLTRSVGHIRS